MFVYISAVMMSGKCRASNKTKSYRTVKQNDSFVELYRIVTPEGLEPSTH